MSCGSNSTTHRSGRRPITALFSKKKQSEKHHTSSSHADVRRSISTKFCTMTEVVRAIISFRKIFWVPSIVLPLGVTRKFGWKRPHQGKLFIILSFIELKQPNLTKLCRLRTRINPVNFVRIVQGIRLLGAIILVKFDFLKFWGRKPTPLNRSRW